MFVASTFLDPCTTDIRSSPETMIMMLNSCNMYIHKKKIDTTFYSQHLMWNGLFWFDIWDFNVLPPFVLRILTVVYFLFNYKYVILFLTYILFDKNYKTSNNTFLDENKNENIFEWNSSISWDTSSYDGIWDLDVLCFCDMNPVSVWAILWCNHGRARNLNLLGVLEWNVDFFLAFFMFKFSKL